MDPSQLYNVGAAERTAEGRGVGIAVVGIAEGASVSIAVGIADEATVGIALEDALGAVDGAAVGTSGQEPARAKYV